MRLLNSAPAHLHWASTWLRLELARFSLVRSQSDNAIRNATPSRIPDARQSVIRIALTCIMCVDCVCELYCALL